LVTRSGQDQPNPKSVARSTIEPQAPQTKLPQRRQLTVFPGLRLQWGQKQSGSPAAGVLGAVDSGCSGLRQSPHRVGRSVLMAGRLPTARRQLQSRTSPR